MLFANPVETQFIQGTFYDQLAEPYYLSADKLESDYAPVRFRRELRLFRRYCPKGSVVDVGCSTGAFLHQLTTRHPDRYTGLGTDVAGPALDYAASRGVNVLRASFLEHNFREQRFDAVTFWAVLEHLAEPGQFLAKARALLKPGGVCFVLVPNAQSLATRFLGTRYRYIMAEHLNFFTEDTLKRLVAHEHGWSVVTLQTTHFNPIVIWQDLRRSRERVPDAERADLLKKTTAWKQNPFLAPARLVYSAAELCLSRMRLADNLVIVLRRR
jgi:2-polyprenyl-3-methyl-5-hydroxy-6-metoxy-1,4-benzoquinol methylase